jgi:hypothetical protein
MGEIANGIYRWVEEAGLATEEPCIDGEIKEN